jgi:hypothetical protein
MKKIYTLILVFVFFAQCGGKKIDPAFSKFNGYYYLHATLRNLDKLGFENGVKYFFAQLDFSKGEIYLLDDETGLMREFEIEHYKNDVFKFRNYQNIYFRVWEESRGQSFSSNIEDKVTQIDFLKNKDDIKSYATGGYFKPSIKSPEECRKFLKEEEEFNKRTSTAPGQE